MKESINHKKYDKTAKYKNHKDVQLTTNELCNVFKARLDSGPARSPVPGSVGLTGGPAGDDVAFLNWRMGFECAKAKPSLVDLQLTRHDPWTKSMS
ncbi:hypothetical protein ACH5RR_008495 [Cinchona calisaya]|uniref:Uncharacterized protein n=1 Tax=Cinchona calisaya TaxID=153742 RepID=A0ABD3AHB0_9GENT